MKMTATATLETASRMRQTVSDALGNGAKSAMEQLSKEK
jgi:hypothetical protein